MTIERPGFSRRKLLSTAAVGVPAMGALSAVNLFGAPAAKANPYVPIDGLWGSGTTVISAMQSRIGVAADGLIGPETIRALAHYLKWSDDSGVLVEPSQVVGSLQGRVQDGWF